MEDEEKKLKGSMDPTTAHALNSKKLCLWKYLLETSGFSDMQVVDVVVKGIPLYMALTPSRRISLTTGSPRLYRLTNFCSQQFGEGSPG